MVLTTFFITLKIKWNVCLFSAFWRVFPQFQFFLSNQKFVYFQRFDEFFPLNFNFQTQVKMTCNSRHLDCSGVGNARQFRSISPYWRLFGIFHWVPLRTAAPFRPASVARQPSRKSLWIFGNHLRQPSMVERLNRLLGRTHQPRQRIHYINRSSISTPKSSIPYSIRSSSHSRFVAHLLQDLCIYTWTLTKKTA